MTVVDRRSRLEQVIVANRVVLPVEAPGEILIAPLGLVESVQGDFLMDADSVAAVIAAFEADDGPAHGHALALTAGELARIAVEILR